jgi:hypothetical protein
VLIQIVMVVLIISFPNLVSVEKKVDMNEQIELKLDTPPPPAEEKKDDEAPQLNFSTDTEKK